MVTVRAKLNRHFLSGTALLAMAMVSIAGPTAAYAASDADASELEQITVTATKRGAVNLQDAPVTIQAISGNQLKAMGAVDFNDYFHMVPGLAVQDNGPGDKLYVIRGINSTGAGTIGVYLDEVIITGENAQDGGGQSPDIKLFDIERVEVLKGPQGTTFGSSSMAGTMRYITNKPNVEEFEGNASTTIRATKHGNVGVIFTGAANVPVVKDKFAIRIAGFYQNEPGYINNQYGNGVNNDLTKAMRVSGTLIINEQLTLSAMAMMQNEDADAKSYYNKTNDFFVPYTGGNFNQGTLAHEPWKDRMKLFNATLDYHPDYGTFTLTGSRLVRNIDFDRDATPDISLYLGLDPATTGHAIIQQPKHRTVNNYEARFASRWDSRFQILIGGFAQKQDVFFRSAILSADTNGFVAANPRIFLDRTLDSGVNEKAVFGELSMSITDQLKTTVGGRWYDIKTSAQADAITSFGGVAGGGAGLGAVNAFTDRGLIGKFNLSYNITQDALTYAQVAQGFRSGGINDQTAAAIANVVIPAGYKSDSLINYEVGVKTSWLDHHLVFNAAAYYIDWTDIQLKSQATNGQLNFPYTGNGGGAHVKGIEVEVQANPMKGLQLGLAANYNTARLSKDNPIPATGMTGDDIPYVPGTTVSLTGSYEWPLGLGLTGVNGTVGAEYSYVSKRYTQLNSATALYYELKPYALVNVRAGVRKDRWSILLFANNLFNNTAITAVSSVDIGVYPDSFYFNRPRTMGATLSADF